MDNNQIERIGVHKTSLFFLEEFNWIEREQSISDYGIDMQIEIKEDEKATGVLIALQIKSGKSYFNNIKDNKIIYIGELKHLEYWENHSLNVLLVLYNPNNKKLYWQSISSKYANIKINKKSWIMEIPLSQELISESKENILNECFNIDNYQIIEENNVSIGIAKRYSVKIISSIKEKYIIKKMIQSIYNKLINMYKDINTLIIYFYKSIYELQNGLPFCTTQWNNKKYEYKLEIIKANDEICDIKIEWNRDYQVYNRFLINNDNFISKYNYIQMLNEIIDFCNKIINDLTNRNLQYALNYILNIENDINGKFNYIIDYQYKSISEVYNLKRITLNVINLIHNILIFLKDNTRSSLNKEKLLNTHLEDIKKQIEIYKNLLIIIEK